MNNSDILKNLKATVVITTFIAANFLVMSILLLNLNTFLEICGLFLAISAGWLIGRFEMIRKVIIGKIKID